MESGPRKFSWRDFLIGLATGIVAAVLGLVLLVTGLVYLASMIAGGSDGIREAALPSPVLPPSGKLAAYGQAAMDWSLQTLTGQHVTLADYRGKVIFLNVWATWCGLCVAEMPSIQTLPVFSAPGRMPPAFQTNAIPATFIIDTSGTVVLRQIGAVQWNQPRTVTFLQTLLNGLPHEVRQEESP